MPLQRARQFVLGASALALVAVGALGLNAVVRDAMAQTDSAAPGNVDQTPPPVPGLQNPNPAVGGTLPLDPALAATPAVPAGAPGLVETPGGITTNLGGSDVAVTSEGGSYEVDGPKRKGKRFPAPTPKP
jgi:hypothetical protein